MAEPEVPVVETSIAAVHTGFKQGRLTARALVDQYLHRIEAYDDKLNAIITVNPAAGDRARELDSTFQTDGFVGPLHGVPVILKDNHATHDLATTAGSKTLEGSVPPRDAVVVRRIRAAGGIVLAKANLQEFSFGLDTVSSLGGATRNPYALDRRPSGSSGGTVAAIAANLGLVGTGTDTCSSVRSPPAFTGLVGIRPTLGLVSRTGIVPLCLSQDTAGPIARTVEDAARVLDVMAGYDARDPVTAAGAAMVPAEGYAGGLDRRALEGARVGVVRAFFGLADDTLDLSEGAASVTDSVEEAVREMERAGATVVDPVEVPSHERLAEARLIDYEFKRDLDGYLAAYAPDAGYGSFREIVESGLVHPWVEERMADPDILEVDSDSLDDNLAYLRRRDRRRRLRVETLAAMADAEVDALVYPVSSVPAVPIPDRQPSSETRCELAAHTGLPAIVAPAPPTPEGLPVGVELLGRPFGERRLIELAFAYEQATGYREAPVEFGPVAG